MTARLTIFLTALGTGALAAAGCARGDTDSADAPAPYPRGLLLALSQFEVSADGKVFP